MLISIHRRHRRLRWLIASLALLVAGYATAQASGGAYTVRKQALLPGTSANAGSLRLSATLGEPAAGQQSGGNFRLTGGFQTPRVPGDGVFGNGFE